MHEAGHGLYEQGLPKLPRGSKPGYFGQPLGEACSLGIHESQSRLWENFVGRSKHFWRWAQPQIVKRLSPAFKQYTPANFYAATNTVTPSLIRVEADEATYNLPIMIRFELERAMLAGDIRVRDLPGEWNARYKKYLGVKVPDDRRGCLQDVHWSSGSVGYFPTYTLGNLYAAQFWETIQQEIPGINGQIAKGRSFRVKTWLNAKTHRHGRQLSRGRDLQAGHRQGTLHGPAHAPPDAEGGDGVWGVMLPPPFPGCGGGRRVLSGGAGWGVTAEDQKQYFDTFR